MRSCLPCWQLRLLNLLNHSALASRKQTAGSGQQTAAEGNGETGTRSQGESTRAMKKIIIKAGKIEAKGELNDSATATAIWQALPIDGSTNTWGEEIYFRIPVSVDLEPSARELVELGDLAYWPQGEALCIFFGATPISGPGEIRPAGAVNVVGQLSDDPKAFLSVASGTSVRIDRA